MSDDLLPYEKPKDPYHLTINGRTQLGTDHKPLIPNLEFRNLLEKVINGDFTTLDQMKSQYTFESFQEQFLNHYYNESSQRIKNCSRDNDPDNNRSNIPNT
jgi:hypothetical protein